MGESFYDVLGVRPDATFEAIETRYRERSAELAIGDAKERVRLDAAYRILRNPNARAHYDRRLRAAAAVHQETPAEQAPHDRETARARHRRRGLLGRLYRGETRGSWLWTLVLGIPLLPLVGAAVAATMGVVGVLLYALILLQAVVYLAPFVLPLWLVSGIGLWRAASRYASAAARVSGRCVGAAVIVLAMLGIVGYADVAYRMLSGSEAAALQRVVQRGPVRDCSKLQTTQDPAARLRLAARCGDLTLVRQLVGQGADVNAGEPDGRDKGRTALHNAAGEDEIAVIDYLLAHGADVNARGDSGYTALHVAAGRGRVRAIERLLKGGADPNALDVRGPPLHAAVLQGHADAARALLEGGADPNGRSPDGYTPIMRLADIGLYFPGHTEVIKLLAASGADLNAVDAQGRTVLEGAHRDAVAALIAAGALPSNYTGNRGVLLPYAARAGNRALVEKLIAQGADIDAADPNGVTATFAAARARDVNLLALFLDRGVPIDTTDARGAGLLYLALERRDERLIDFLLARKASVRPAHRMPPLLALDGNCGNAIAGRLARRLIEAGADPQVVGSRRTTPLHWCVRDIDLLTLFLDRGSNVNARTDTGLTPLHYAVQHEQAKALPTLIARGADVNAKDDEGSTALHLLASRPGAADVKQSVQLLVDAGADTSLQDAKGRTAQAIFKAVYESRQRWPEDLDAGAIADLLTPRSASRANVKP